MALNGRCIAADLLAVHHSLEGVEHGQDFRAIVKTQTDWVVDVALKVKDDNYIQESNEIPESVNVAEPSHVAADNRTGFEQQGHHSNGTGTRVCRVPDCHADVSGSKKYNSRYRICEDHRRAPSVAIDGHLQRFCQLCAKFQDLSEFDGEPELLSVAGSLQPFIIL